MTAPLMVDAVVLEAAALADKGAIDPNTIPCGTCGELAIAHDVDEQGHEHQVPPAYTLAAAALAAAERDVMDDIVEHVRGGYVPSGKFGARVSDAGKCRRQIWYRERPPADYEPRTDIDERRATIGSIIHKAAEDARRARYSWKWFEFELQIPGLDKSGVVDEYDPVLGEVADTKSAGRGKWVIVGDDGPTDDMWRQLRIYGLALERAALPVKTLKIVAINRDTGAEEPFYEPYDPQTGQDALDELVAVTTAIEAGATMPRDGYGPADWRCGWCPALDHCWQTDRAARLGRSPASLVKLGENPDDPSIEWAARELLRITKERLELDKAEEQASDLIQGVTPGTYGKAADDGGVELYVKHNRGYLYKQAYTGLVDLYALADDDPAKPAPDCLPAVPVTKSQKTAVKKAARAGAAAKKTRTKKTTPADVAAAVVEAMTEGTPK